MSKYHIIYIPGLGDGYDPGRRFALWFWRVYGVRVQMISSSWADGGEFNTKVERVERAIDAARERGKSVVLIGESAGGSMAINIYAADPDKVYRVVTLCGKNNAPDKVSPVLYRKNPAFRTSMEQVEAATASLNTEQRANIVSIHPLYDPVVPVPQTLVPGCRRVRVWTIGHQPTIILLLTVLSGVVMRTIRQR